MLSKPIFISGLRKSGTSMVKNLLDNHPELFVYPPNEFHFFKFTDMHNLGRITKPDYKNKRTMAQVREDICRDRWFNPYQRQTNIDWHEFVDIKTLHALIRASKADNYKDLFVDIAIAMASAATTFEGDLNTSRFTCKGVQQEEFFPELQHWFPDLKMVYVLRNPYAQLNSAINNMRHGRKGPEETLRVGTDAENLDVSFRYPYLGPRLRQMRVSYYFMRKFSKLFPERFYILKYDDLLIDPDRELQELCKFLDIKFHESMRELTLCGKPIERQGWSVKKHIDNKISQKPLNVWKKQLSGLGIRLISTYFDDILYEFNYGYETSDHPLWKRCDPSEEIVKYIGNRLLFTKPVRKLI